VHQVDASMDAPAAGPVMESMAESLVNQGEGRTPMKVQLDSLAEPELLRATQAPKDSSAPRLGEQQEQLQFPGPPGQVAAWDPTGYGASAFQAPYGPAVMPYGAMPGMYPLPWMMMPQMGMPPMGMPMAMPGAYPNMGGMHPNSPMLPQSPGSKGAKGRPPEGGGGTKSRGRRRLKAKAAREAASAPFDVADDDANASRSELLNELRKQHSKCKLTVEEILPSISEFMQDQHGSRFLQSKLDEASPQERQLMFEAILADAASHAGDVFGNFVIQKFFDVGTVEQRRVLAQQLIPDLLKLSCETHGCRVVQKAIQHVPRESQLAIAGKLGEDVIGCIESMHGNHVIQKCVEQMPPDSVTFIIKAIEEQTEKMASHMYGCRVVQRLLEHCTSQQLARMLDSILEAVPRLAQDPYGNYVVQHMLEHGRREDKRKIIRLIQDNIVHLAKHKCSSNVVEKALEIATVGEHASMLEDERAALMRKVLGDPQDPNLPLRQMMDDRFGNYIVQRMIEHSRGPERELLYNLLLSAEPQLRSSSSGRHILAALNKETGTAIMQ